MIDSGKKHSDREIMFWDKQLAMYILSHSLCDTDHIRKAWFIWMKNGLRQWPAQRQGTRFKDPYTACTNHLMKKPGMYCEGLYINNLIDVPEIAIWAVDDDGLQCFSHDLTMPHGLHGCDFEMQKCQKLRNQHSVQGPYLFSEDPTVIKYFGLQTI
ncbi:hypothetical protein [Asticcacaulis sp.]|uniref:hypothetical protein n=1 Tax=Asticcacaulis sp. TaxID=1872648 RepID=UPI0026380725|nr:hypothetical protein [Asticcacaulis sp.]